MSLKSFESTAEIKEKESILVSPIFNLSCTLYPDKYSISGCNGSFPDGKTQRRENRRRAIRRRKGRL